MIGNKLNLFKEIININECRIEEIDSKDSKIFLDSNHILGNINSSIRIGLFKGSELVSLITFGKIRNVFGNKKMNENSYELLRYCNKLNTCIIGGIKKLYEYFRLNYKSSQIVCFANKRYDDGKLLEEMGFKLDKIMPPNYWYIVGKKRKHKFLFRKSLLIKEGYNPNKSEHEIMKERKIARIYDCGSIRYIN